MDLQFVPDDSDVGSIDFRPYMLEVAWNYCEVVLLPERRRRGMIEQTLGALAIEIVLKSFNSAVATNTGRIDETYEFSPGAAMPRRADKHNLLVLANALRPDVRKYLLEPLDEDVIREHQDTFKRSRYFYEPTAPRSSSDSAIRLAAKLICKVMYLYKRRGSTDPFVANFDVNAVYFSVVQRVAIVQSSAA